MSTAADAGLEMLRGQVMDIVLGTIFFVHRSDCLRDCGDPVAQRCAQGQFASAAYVWIDIENRNALYSAAGHPPLLCWRNSKDEMQRIESNGLLFGVEPGAAYPVCSVAVEPSDRFLLYTDGVTETENAAGEAFGDRQLERVVCDHRVQPASELSTHLLAELRRWRPAAVSQQHDVTLIVVDIL